MTRPDEWARVDYRSRATAAICVIATTLVAFVTLTAYVATQVGFAEGVLLPTPPREPALSRGNVRRGTSTKFSASTVMIRCPLRGAAPKRLG